LIENSCDILIVGGGVGGTAAALAASSYGLKVILTEDNPWIGGQLTTQGVPPDEHPWIENFGSTALYRQFRKRVRQHYLHAYPLNPSLRDTAFNPGGGFVSGLCHEPQIAHEILIDMLAEPIVQGSLQAQFGQVAIGAEIDGDRISAVHFRNKWNGYEEVIHAQMVIDCTELGDLLPLCGAEYVSGAESQHETGELHAAETANADDVQGFTWCLAVAYDSSASHIIDRPSRYDFWRDYRPQLTDTPWPGRLLNWTAVSPITLEPRRFDLFAQEDQPYNSLWNYRKIVSSENLGVPIDDVTLVNWPQNDYFLTNIIDKSSETIAAALEDSKELSLSLLYWMQTEAPRSDGGGGVGYPGLYPCQGVLGTNDGLALAPYIRESRRIKALFTVTEAHVGAEMRAEAGHDTAAEFDDTVGVGSYRIDLHPTPAGKNYVDISSLPFQIPLGSLIPIRLRNLIAGAKNIGVTHITNGCYRLHPVEWNIGESAGHLAAFALTKKLEPRAVREKQKNLHEFQTRLTNAKVELSWPEEIKKIRR
jgi:hypothetical protein